ncbi:MAG: hypothetical protein GF344_11395 [Chitinivibrionales bacterium]|nr:hypothetical protein [Chitinivibrionales bacterium]MBD3357405.1 hypothetical protein [Chitinivibrionales bacterium]
MLKRFATVAIPVLAVGAFAASYAICIDSYVYRCTTATEPIVLDGIADEAAWESADTCRLSLDINSIEEDYQNDVITEEQKYQYFSFWRGSNKDVLAKMLWNDTGLYVYFFGYHAQVWNALEGRDVAGYYNENTFELFLDPKSDGKDFIELNISTRGDITDYLNYRPWRGSTVFDLEGIETSTHVKGTHCDDIGMSPCNQDQDSGWALEMKIPFSNSFTISSIASRNKNYWRDTLSAMQFEMPPAITEEGINDWQTIADIITAEEPPVTATMLISRLDSSSVSRIKNGTMEQSEKTAMLAALNEMVADITFFIDNAADMTLRDTVYGLSPKKSKKRGDRNWTIHYGGTLDAAFPLNNANAKLEWTNDDKQRAEADTVFVEGCSVFDSITQVYPDTVILEAGGMAGAYIDEVLDDSIIIHDPETDDYSLKSPLEAIDSIHLAWLNLGLLEDLLLPGAVAQLNTIENSIVRAVDIMGGLSIPPDSGDEWGMNLNYIATPACSLYHVGFAWANPSKTVNAPHSYACFGKIRFVGHPDVSVRRSAALVGSGRHFSLISQRGGRLVLSYTLPQSAKRANLKLFTLSGALVRTMPISVRKGPQNTTVDARTVGAGTYLMRLEVDGSVLANQKAVIQ